MSRLRADVAPTAERVAPGATMRVSGDAASSVDVTKRMRDTTPLVIGFVLGSALVLLLATFRSLPLALGVLALNLAVGRRHLRRADRRVPAHWAEKALDFTSSGTVTDWVPITAFVILFGLSMDYTILVLERIREARRAGLVPARRRRRAWRRPHAPSRAPRWSWSRSSRSFVTLPLIELKMLGITLAAGRPDRRDDRPRHRAAGRRDAARRARHARPAARDPSRRPAGGPGCPLRP